MTLTDSDKSTVSYMHTHTPEKIRKGMEEKYKDQLKKEWENKGRELRKVFLGYGVSKLKTGSKVESSIS